jgi:hypothetical protein
VKEVSILFGGRCGVKLAAAACFACILLAAPGLAPAQSLNPDSYYWYVPEHEKYVRTVFYGEPRFDTRQVRVTRTQRFKLLGGSKGWFLLQFDIAGRAYIYQRLLRGLVYNPAAGDPWTEFQRASVFDEDPSKIEARLQSMRTDPQAPETADSKLPVWKRYKESWGLKPSRTAQLPSAGDPADPAASSLPPRPVEKKPRSKYPLLPPIGSEPQRPEAEPGAPTEPGDDPNARPLP